MLGSLVQHQVLAELDDRKLLVKDPDPDGTTLTRQVKITGLTDKRLRYVCILGLLPNKAKATPKKKSKFKSRVK
jgi:hypothetical protein